MAEYSSVISKHGRAMYTSFKSQEHLHDADDSVKDQVDKIVKAFALADGCDEKLKFIDQMNEVGLTNNYTHCA